jgi:hypothetical protein
MTDALTKCLETLGADVNAQNEIALVRSLLAYARDHNSDTAATVTNPYRAAISFFEGQDLNPWVMDLIRKYLNTADQQYQARTLR